MLRKASALFFALTTLLVLSTQVYAGDDEKPTNTAQVVENFTLTDYNGKEHSLSDYKDAKAVALIFVSTRCPVSNAYNERMAKLNADFKERGVVFIGLNANVAEDLSEIKKHAGEHDLAFTILKDENNVIADKLEASVTPEVYVLNPKREVLYHGRIDDSRDPAKVASEDLRTALEQVLAGKEVSEVRTKAFGCSIKRVVTETEKSDT